MELLGKGAFANVYRGRSKLTGLEVAIKMVQLRTNAFIHFLNCFRWALSSQVLYAAVGKHYCRQNQTP